MPHEAFTILTVCSGNLCRSPMAEQLLRARLGDLPGVGVESAGVVAQDGDPMPTEAAALSRSYGGDPSGHSARRLVEAQIANANLVLAMAREHRRDVVTLWPRASRYTFTVREFARLAEGIDADDFASIDSLPGDDVPGRLNAAIELLASRRGFVDAAPTPEDDDVIDPYRRDDAAYALSGQQLVPAVEAVVALLRRAAAHPGA